MNWKVWAAVGAGVAGVVWAVQQRQARQEAVAGSGWAAATDRVVPAPTPTARDAVRR